VGQRFPVVIGKVGINPCVDVPAYVSAALGHTGCVAVRATLNGQPFRAGLVSLGGGRHRLFINGQMRKAAGVDVGDAVEVELDYDPRPRTRPVPSQLVTALKDGPTARAAWDALTPSRRNEMPDYLNSLKQPNSIQRNVDKILATVLRPAPRRCGGV
jgi:hypothetical protein